MTNNEYVKHRLDTSPLPTRWLWFYTNVLLLIHLIVEMIVLISDTYLLAFSRLTRIMTLTSITVFPKLIIIIFTYKELKKLSEKAYIWNIVYLWSCVILNLFINISKNYKLPYLLFFLVAYAIWLSLNLIYFKKRKYLFEPEQREHYSSYTPPSFTQPDLSQSNISESATLYNESEIKMKLDNLRSLYNNDFISKEEYQQKKRELQKFM